MRPPLRAIFFPKQGDSEAWASLTIPSILVLGGILPLFRYYGRIGLVGFAIPAAGLLAMDLVVQRGRRSFGIASELSGILILCLGAPAAYYAAHGILNSEAWWVWRMNTTSTFL